MVCDRLMVWPQSVISTKRQLLAISAIGVSNQPHRASISSHIFCYVEQNLIHHKIVRIYCLNIALQDLYSFHDTMTFCCSCYLLDCLWLSTALSMISSSVSFSSPPLVNVSSSYPNFVFDRYWAIGPTTARHRQSN